MLKLYLMQNVNTVSSFSWFSIVNYVGKQIVNGGTMFSLDFWSQDITKVNSSAIV